MDDKTGALERLKAIMAKAEQVDMSSVKIGDIIYVPLDEEDGLILKDGYKDRNKYIVIIGFTPEGVAIGALLINSEIDSSKRSEELLNCQYPLMVRNYRDILDYDSWLDCSDIFELSKLKITEKNGKLKGCLISEDRERVIQFLRETEVFDNATKRRYGIIKSFKNRYSIYGSPSSSLSPYNPNTLTPPVIYLRGEKIGCLSKNVNLTNRVDPDVLNDWMISQRLFD